jgi:hypothetical protein
MISLVAVAATAVSLTAAPKDTAGTDTGQVLVTASGKGRAAMNVSDVQVSENHNPARVLGVTPLAQSGLQLWILIDNSSQQSLGLQFGDIRKFIMEQPANTQVGIGYMEYGDVKKVQDLTTDHQLAANALHITLGRGTITPSPYMAVDQLIKKWPATNAAREVLMITSGIDPYGPGPDDPYLLGAIDRAQRAGVVVHAIYYGAGRRGLYWGQNDLSRLTSETGGAFFWEGTINPVSLAPYLADLNQLFSRQYLVTFSASSPKTGLQNIKVNVEAPGVKVIAPARVNIGS